MTGVLSLAVPYFGLIHILVVFIRVSGALLFAPVWGHPGLPAFLRVILLFSTALMIASVAPAGDMVYTNPGLVIPAEFLIGLLLGMGVRIAFAGLHFGGQMLGFHLGYSAVQTIDPTTANRSTLMSGFMTLAGYSLLLATDQHHTIIRALVDSYRVFPVGTILETPQWFERLFQSAAEMFVIGWKIALPVFIVTLLAELAVGIIARMQPQISTMVITAPLKLCVGLLALGASLTFLPRVLSAAVNLMVLKR
jgi:flagellar biosynthetic protein FliR